MVAPDTDPSDTLVMPPATASVLESIAVGALMALSEPSEDMPPRLIELGPPRVMTVRTLLARTVPVVVMLTMVMPVPLTTTPALFVACEMVEAAKLTVEFHGR